MLKDNVRLYRVARRMSQEQLGRRSSLPQKTVSLIERGLEATPAQIRRLARAFGVSVEILTGPTALANMTGVKPDAGEAA